MRYSLCPKRAFRIVNICSVTCVAINTGRGCLRMTMTTMAVMKMKKWTRIAATTAVVWYLFTASSMPAASMCFSFNHLLPSLIQFVKIFSGEVWHVVLGCLPRVRVGFGPELPAHQHVDQEDGCAYAYEKSSN